MCMLLGDGYRWLLESIASGRTSLVGQVTPGVPTLADRAFDALGWNVYWLDRLCTAWMECGMDRGWNLGLGEWIVSLCIVADSLG